MKHTDQHLKAVENLTEKIIDKEKFLSDVCDIILGTLVKKDSKRMDLLYNMVYDPETNHTHHFDRLKNEEVKIKINPDLFWNDVYEEIEVFLNQLQEDK